MISLFQTHNRFFAGLLSLVMNIKTSVPTSVAGQGELSFQRVGTVSLFKGTMSNRLARNTNIDRTLGESVAHSEVISLKGKTFETAGFNRGKVSFYLATGLVIGGLSIIEYAAYEHDRRVLEDRRGSKN